LVYALCFGVLFLISGCRLFSPSGSGIKPKINIIEPLNGDTVDAVGIVIKVEVTSKEDILKVKFSDNNFFLGEIHSNPYELFWETSNVSSGEHGLSAEATDISGNTGKSDDVTVFVTKQEIYDWNIFDLNMVEDLNCIFALDTAHIWGCGNGGKVIFYDGSNWQHSSICINDLSRIFFVSKDEGWCIGGNSLFGYKNGEWRLLQSIQKEKFTSLFMLNDSLGWIGDSKGQIFTFNGDSLSGYVQIDTSIVNDLLGFGLSDIWALCGSYFFHNTGLGWGKDTSFPGEEIYALCSINDWSLWAGGTKLFKRYGTEWLVLALPDSLPPNSLVQDIYFFDFSSGVACGGDGENGFIIEYDGVKWRKNSLQKEVSLNGILIFPNGDGWAVGNGGTILQRRGK